MKIMNQFYIIRSEIKCECFQSLTDSFYSSQTFLAIYNFTIVVCNSIRRTQIFIFISRIDFFVAIFQLTDLS